MTNAFNETTTVRFSREGLEREMFELKRTVRRCREMVRLANVGCNWGLSSCVEVLYAMSLFCPAESRLVEARQSLLVDCVNIYMRLGGRWNRPESPPGSASPAFAPAAKAK